MKKNTIVNKRDAAELISKSGNDFAVIPNPGYIHPSFDIVPLAPKLKKLTSDLVAVVMDMDGTITTTEELCIHSLEFMIRRISGLMDLQIWAGLDHKKDYPHIIGNSTTKHVEYLIRTYKNKINHQALLNSYIDSAIWTLRYGRDKKRRIEVVSNLKSFGINHSDIKRKEWFKVLSRNFPDDFNSIVKAGIDIYYQRYHEILAAMKTAEKIPLKEILPVSSKQLIEPMPGAAIFLALIKGYLADEAACLAEILMNEYENKIPGIRRKLNPEKISAVLRDLSAHFAENPVKTAVVTSSIFYEADIVMSEVFKIFREQVNIWNISTQRKKLITGKFSGYDNYFEAFITASDSSEIRLKPHRDLYSIALHRLAVPPEYFNSVIGFEDSESGTFAIRAAGIGLCAAVPFAKTSGHNLKAASVILKGGLPEAIIKHNLFLSK